MKRNFDVVHIQSDGERGIHSHQLDDFCAEKKIQTLKTGAGQHEAQVERFIRTLKAEIRNKAGQVIPASLPSELIIFLVMASVTAINCRLTSALVGDRSPHQLWFGHEHIHARDFEYGFGDLALATTPNQKNDVSSRADTVFVLYPVFNGLHGYLVWKLGTQQAVVRNANTLKPIPWSRNDQKFMERLGNADPGGIDMPRREEAITLPMIVPSVEAAALPEILLEDPAPVVPHRAEDFREQNISATPPTVAEFVPHLPVADEEPESMVDAPAAPASPGFAPPPAQRSRRGGGCSLASLPPPAAASRSTESIHKISVNQSLRDHPEATEVALTNELGQMLKLGVFDPVDYYGLTQFERDAVIYSSAFIKHKYKPDGEYDKCKARLVAGGNLQDKLMYETTSSPTASSTAILTVIGIAARNGAHVATIDIGGAYLNAPMAPTCVKVHMAIDRVLTARLVALDPSYAPFVRANGTVVVLLKMALYGTVEAAKLWYDHIISTAVAVGFVANPYERCVLNKIGISGHQITIVIYVDDILVTCVDIAELLAFKIYLLQVFPEVTYHDGGVLSYVGMTLDLMSVPRCVKVTMNKSIRDIVASSGVSQPYKTPATDGLFDIDETSPRLSAAAEKFFRSFVARMLYVAKRVRPEILCTVAFLTTRVQTCTEEDLAKLHRALGYLMHEPERGITIDVGQHASVKAYIDAAYACHPSGRSHTGGFLVYGRGGPVYNTSTKQPIVTKSSTEAELVAMSDVSSESINLRAFVIAQGEPARPVITYQDNNSAMALIQNGGPCSKRSKHIDIRYFWVAEKVLDGTVTVVRCPTETMWANLLTKSLPRTQFVAEREGVTNWDQSTLWMVD
jgi:hypothetical protein